MQNQRITNYFRGSKGKPTLLSTHHHSIVGYLLLFVFSIRYLWTLVQCELGKLFQHWKKKTLTRRTRQLSTVSFLLLSDISKNNQQLNPASSCLFSLILRFTEGIWLLITQVSITILWVNKFLQDLTAVFDIYRFLEHLSTDAPLWG